MRLSIRKLYVEILSMRRRGGDIGTNLYDGAAAYGRFMAWIGLFVGCFIGFILLVVGIWLIFRKDKYSEKTTAIAKNVECKSGFSGNTAVTNCIMNLVYTADGKIYDVKYAASNKLYVNGESVNIRYNPSNPEEYTTMFPSRWFGYILTGFALVLIIGSWFQWYITQKFQFAAAASGVGSAYGTFIER